MESVTHLILTITHGPLHLSSISTPFHRWSLEAREARERPGLSSSFLTSEQLGSDPKPPPVYANNPNNAVSGYKRVFHSLGNYLGENKQTD